MALIQEPYIGSIGEMRSHKNARIVQKTTARQKPVKAAVIIFGDHLEVIEDPQLVDENIAAVTIKAGNLRIGVVSVYFEGDCEMEPYLNRLRQVCAKLPQNIIVGGDVNAWSTWWGSNSEDHRGERYASFLNEMDLHILNTGEVPTFEVHRGGRLCTSIVDVTVCSAPLLDKINGWSVDRNLTTSDHNAITFSLGLEEGLTAPKPKTTRVYNTKKAKWSEFQSAFRSKLATQQLSVSKVENINSPEDLEETVELYLACMKESCDEFIPKAKGGGVVDSRIPWWTESLTSLKRDALKKKRRIGRAAPHRRQSVIDDYIAAKDAYNREAAEAQTKSWKEFCSRQSRESMWDGIYRVIRSTSKRREDQLLTDDAGETLSPEESAKKLATTFYPDDSADSETHEQQLIRSESEGKSSSQLPGLSGEDPPFTAVELDRVLQMQNPNKSPGPDGFTADICRVSIESDEGVFLAIANRCLSLEYFPKPWKIAHVCILKKPGKDDYTKPKSYRPIGLLSVMGKILEKMVISRLQWHILPQLSRRQYGFMPQRGTEDHLYDTVTHINQEIKNKKIVVVVSLDIEGAFDNAWWPAVKAQLIKKKCPKNLYGIITSYLTDRKVRIGYMGEVWEKSTTKGCVQGSIGGPFLWNLLLDTLLTDLERTGVRCQAFADDVVLLFSGHSTPDLQAEVEEALNMVTRWGAKHKLKFAAHKTNAMVLTKKLKFDAPVLHMNGETLQLVDQIRLLGLVLDNKLAFNAHVTSVCKKATDIYKQVARAAKATWGLNPEIVRTIYVSVIEPIILYAANVWAPAAEKLMIQKQLGTLQRGFAQKICRAYRTVSLTSALILADLLPLDLRALEERRLYIAKIGGPLDTSLADREMEGRVPFEEQPHPAELISIGYGTVEDPESLQQLTGPQIYTDGSKIEGKVGAALTLWSDNEEKRSSKFRLESFCTVFQSEMYALRRAMEVASKAKEKVVSILSDSKSSLELLRTATTAHPIGFEIRRAMRGIRAEGRDVKLFWVRAHVGTPGNERADILAKEAALHKKTAPDYDRYPKSYAKRIIRADSVRTWQARCDASGTGEVTRLFFPSVEEAHRIIRGMTLNFFQVQALTGHGGFAEYLHRFKLREDPFCECDPLIAEDVLHDLIECPRFQVARFDLESEIGTEISRSNLATIMATKTSRLKFLSFAEKVVKRAAERNKSPKSSQLPQQTPAPSHTMNLEFMEQGESGTPGLRIRGVPLFMDDPKEKIGLAFSRICSKKRVTISPGLAALLNGSTSNTSMNRETYKSLTYTRVLDQCCRIAKSSDKAIYIFECGTGLTGFADACKVLSGLGEIGQVAPRIISVDSMEVGMNKGEVADLIGCVKASYKHEVIVYENRGEDLGFLKTIHPATYRSEVTYPMEPEAALSGAEKYQREREKERADQRREAIEREKKREAKNASKFSIIGKMFEKMTRLQPGCVSGSVKPATNPPMSENQKTQILPATTWARTDLVRISRPDFRPVKTPRDHVINAFLEYLAVVRATKEINLYTCKNILESYRPDSSLLFKAKLEKEEATIYNNDTSEVLEGAEMCQHMVAYNATSGFVELDGDGTAETGRVKYRTPPDDPIVVTARCTKTMLDDRILEMAKSMTEPVLGDEPFEHWEVPKITWVNGVPGCGKTTWIARNYVRDSDIIITATLEAANELRHRLEHKLGSNAKSEVRTMASLLVNGSLANKTYNRLIVDEALMSHFGAIVMATRITGAGVLVLMGDTNQLPYIDREHLFALQYDRPHTLATISQELQCTHRNPIDVAYALNNIYKGIYSSKSRVRSLKLERYSGVNIPKTLPNTLYLVHTQKDKRALKTTGYGEGLGSRVLTIHEAQGMTYDMVVIVRASTKKLPIYDSIQHAVVAVSRHTVECVYYTDDGGDAIGKLVGRAVQTETRRLIEYNMKMAMHHRDMEVVEKNITQIKEIDLLTHD